MAKKSGKQAPQAAQNQAQTAEQQTPAQGNGQQQAQGSERQPNVFLNRISEKMIRPIPNAKDGKDWTSVSFGMLIEDGQKAIGSILVRNNQVMDSTRKGEGGERKPNPGFKNVLLGQPNQHYNVSLSVEGADGKFEPLMNAEGKYINRSMTPTEIREAADAANKAYRAQKKAAEKDSRAAEAPEAPEAPQAESDGLEA